MIKLISIYLGFIIILYAYRYFTNQNLNDNYFNKFEKGETGEQIIRNISNKRIGQIFNKENIILKTIRKKIKTNLLETVIGFNEVTTNLNVDSVIAVKTSNTTKYLKLNNINPIIYFVNLCYEPIGKYIETVHFEKKTGGFFSEGKNIELFDVIKITTDLIMDGNIYNNIQLVINGEISMSVQLLIELYVGSNCYYNKV